MILILACNPGSTITVTVPANTQVSQEQPSITSRGVQHRVTIKAATFYPLEIHIKAWDTVTWVNEDTNAHTVTSLYHYQDEDDVSHIFIAEAWDSGDIHPGQSYSKTFNRAGTFEYMSLPLRVRSPIDQYFEFVAQLAVGVVIVD